MDDDARIEEASCLGLRPGAWPRELVLDGQRWLLGRIERADGEVIAAHYEGPRGLALVVLND